MTKQPLPQGTRVQLIVSAVTAGFLVLLMIVVGTLVAASPDTKNPGAALLVLAVVGVACLGLLGLANWLMVRRVRRNPDLRRRQLNGRAQAVLSVGGLLAYLVGSLTSAVIGADGWARFAVTVVVAVVVLGPVVVLAKRLDPRVRWFRRPDPAPEEPEPPARRTEPW